MSQKCDITLAGDQKVINPIVCTGVHLNPIRVSSF